ncbi:MAG: hypothetical protein QOJ65_1249 [Fimbriimonadaceae bacterium]|nr:hypothetical protein [Fimbriimonadaceae bacterium]
METETLINLPQTREARTTSVAANLVKTLLQIIVIWGLFLWVIPMLIVRVEMLAAIPTFATSTWQIVGLLLFMAMSTLGLVCVSIFVWLGHGTPLPMDTATRFVVAGPYRHIRNPMAIAGLGQGFAAALVLGSYLSILYVFMGVLVWNFIARPWEEADLVKRFGSTYLDYQARVRCWIPTFRPYPCVIAEHAAIEAE